MSLNKLSHHDGTINEWRRRLKCVGQQRGKHVETLNLNKAVKISVHCQLLEVLDIQSLLLDEGDNVDVIYIAILPRHLTLYHTEE